MKRPFQFVGSPVATACRSAAWVCLVAVITSNVAGVPPGAKPLELADGVVTDATLAAIAPGGSTWIAADGGRVDAATGSVVRWGRCPPWPRGPVVLLDGGGVIAGTLESLADGRAVVRADSLGRLEMPADAVVGFRGSVATGPGELFASDEDAARPRIALANGDRLAAASIAVRAGSLAVDSAAAGIPLAVVAGIDLPATARSAKAATAAAPRMLVALEDGSRFPIASVAVASAAPGTARLDLVAGHATVAAQCDGDMIVAVAIDGGRPRLLASLEPEVFEQSPAFGPAWPLARDRTLAGGWAAARGLTAFTALGVHGPARLRYRLEKPAIRFEAVAAIDDSAGRGGSVAIRVLEQDGAGRWREAFASGVLCGEAEPLAIRAELHAATGIELVVDSADRGDVLDRTIWLDPVVISAP